MLRFYFWFFGCFTSSQTRDIRKVFSTFQEHLTSWSFYRNPAGGKRLVVEPDVTSSHKDAQQLTDPRKVRHWQRDQLCCDSVKGQPLRNQYNAFFANEWLELGT